MMAGTAELSAGRGCAKKFINGQLHGKFMSHHAYSLHTLILCNPYISTEALHVLD